MGDRIYYGGSGRAVAFIYISLFMLAVAGFTDSSRLMLSDLNSLSNRLTETPIKGDKCDPIL